MAGMVMLALLRRWAFDVENGIELVDLGLNDKSFEALRAGQIDAALLPPEKAFLAEEEGFRLIADSLDLECHWVPLATSRRFLAGHRDLVERIVSANKPQVLEKCYELFAARFEETLIPSPNSVNAILHEVALQDPRAANVTAASIVETFF
jgi:hypothetical protein